MEKFYEWNRGDNIQFTPNFNSNEFECPMGDRFKISIRLVELLQKVRKEYGKSITITSGYRTKEYQEDLKRRGYKTAKGTSPHELGLAVDLSWDGRDNLLEIVKKYFPCIGIAKDFIHVDVRSDKKREWSY